MAPFDSNLRRVLFGPVPHPAADLMALPVSEAAPGLSYPQLIAESLDAAGITDAQDRYQIGGAWDPEETVSFWNVTAALQAGLNNMSGRADARVLDEVTGQLLLSDPGEAQYVLAMGDSAVATMRLVYGNVAEYVRVLTARLPDPHQQLVLRRLYDAQVFGAVAKANGRRVSPYTEIVGQSIAVYQAWHGALSQAIPDVETVHREAVRDQIGEVLDRLRTHVPGPRLAPQLDLEPGRGIVPHRTNLATAQMVLDPTRSRHQPLAGVVRDVVTGAGLAVAAGGFDVTQRLREIRHEGLVASAIETGRRVWDPWVDGVRSAASMARVLLDRSPSAMDIFWLEQGERYMSEAVLSHPILLDVHRSMRRGDYQGAVLQVTELLERGDLPTFLQPPLVDAMEFMGRQDPSRTDYARGAARLQTEDPTSIPAGQFAEVNRRSLMDYDGHFFGADPVAAMGIVLPPQDTRLGRLLIANIPTGGHVHDMGGGSGCGWGRDRCHAS